MSRDVVGKERVGDAARVVVAAYQIKPATVDAIVVLKHTTVDLDRAAVDTQSATDSALSIVVAEVGASEFHVAVDETQAAAIHIIDGVYSRVSQVVFHSAIVNLDRRPFRIQGTTMFAREVAKQGAVADDHVVAVEDAQRTAVLVVVKGGFAILEATVIQFGCTSPFHADAVPATSSKVEEMKSSGIGYSKENRVVLRPEGVERGPILDADTIKAIEDNGCSSHNIQ